MSERAAVIELDGVCRSYGEGTARVDAVRDVNLTVRAGEFAAVMGPSGCGKSTLLHLIGALDAPTSGRVVVDGRDLAAMTDDELTLLRRRRIGFVFQAFNLITVLSAAENVAISLRLDGVAVKDADGRAAAALDRVGLAERRDHVPAKLSGGEQQRVALARAIVNEPIILLADEPTGNLDTRSGDQILALLRRLVDERRQTVLMVTHNVRHAALADRVISMRDGGIIQDRHLVAGRDPRDVIAELESIA